jgi:AraC-like DNA-binding protein
MSVTRQHLVGPTLRTLDDRQRIDWHDHAEHQLIYPSRGVLEVSTSVGAWVVPPHRAVWIPAGVPHAHRAHGRTLMRALAFPGPVNPLRTRQPAVLAVTPLLREVIVSLTGGEGRATETATGNEVHKAETRSARSDAASAGLSAGTAGTAGTAGIAGTARTADADADAVGNGTGRRRTPEQRRTLELVALDELGRAEPLALCLPSPTDERLRDITAILLADPSDPRTLAEFGAAVGASERTLSRLFRAQTAMSFPAWRAQLRLHHSVKLLAGGESVTSVGSSCGYGSTSAFIESFRRAFGTTPGRYGRDD